MTFPPANDGITLALGSSTLRLRPSLRAACILEQFLDGFAGLERRIADFHFGTLRKIIEAAAVDRDHAKAFLDRLDQTPLGEVATATQAPIIELIAGFIPASDPDAKPSNATPMPWREVYRDLYRLATGWLGWTPDAAWNATPTEITEAFAGHMAMLKAVHGSSDTSATPSKPVDPDQAQRNITAGLDPEFDRDGLMALKAKFQ